MRNMYIVSTICVASLLILSMFGPVWGQSAPSPDAIREALLPKENAGEGGMMARGIGSLRREEPSGHHELPQVHIQFPFELNQYVISPEAIPYLQALGQALRDDVLKRYTFELQGHTCSLGSEDHNLWLSRKRAEAVKAYLTEHFEVSPDQLETLGYGMRNPKWSNETEEGRRKAPGNI